MEELIPLFSTPLYIKKLQSSLPEEIKNHIFSLKYTRTAANNGWQSVNVDLLMSPELKYLKDIIQSHVEHYAYNLIKITPEIKLRLVSSWAIRHEKGDWSHSHIHTNSIFSGVFYLKTSEGCGSIVFQKPYNLCNTVPAAVFPPLTEATVINSESWEVNPEDNMLLIFPSSLQHAVTISQSEEPRYVISFNFFLSGELGQKEYLNYINL